MSLQEIQFAAARKMISEELPTDPGQCRAAAIALLALAASVDITQPRAIHSALVWPHLPSSPQEERVHYAFMSESLEGTLFINPIKDAGFPEFNQITDNPPGLLKEMVKTPEVI